MVEDLKKRHADRLLLVEARTVGGGTCLLAVLEVDGEALAAERSRLAGRDGMAVEVIDRATWEAMRRLATAGLLQMRGPPACCIRRHVSLRRRTRPPTHRPESKFLLRCCSNPGTQAQSR
ncbi:MAG: hypothetical protein HYU60_04250 [Magnetospirillum sp.]|nr:hypothetical protein [Magnetospirillum sp.]